jgi:uncharacterized RDD family membrane protein YckC
MGARWPEPIGALGRPTSPPPVHTPRRGFGRAAYAGLLTGLLLAAVLCLLLNPLGVL